MRTRYVLVLLFCLVMVLTMIISYQQGPTIQVKQVFESSDIGAAQGMKNIHEETEKYVIEGFFPVTKYEILNQEIENKLNVKVLEFKAETEKLNIPEGGVKYTLGIVYDQYQYQDILSFVVRVTKDVGGAHPFTAIFTLSYDTKTNKIVTIEDLVDMNSNFLKIVSDHIRSVLSNNEKIKQNFNAEMFAKGTEPRKENFKNFAFSKEGIVLFFESYAIAPYSAGSFDVTVPYDMLNLHKKT